MGNASSYKFTKDRKICLPTLIKMIETDKVTQLINKKHDNEDHMDIKRIDKYK